MRQPILKSLIYFFFFTFTAFSSANEYTPEELERWFNSDSMDPPKPIQEAKEVNEGNLVFLSEKPKKELHHHKSSVTILPNSLNDGWILTEQCHSNIDKVAAAQILFKKGKAKDIKVVSVKNIEKAWVEGNSVQMENIKADATLCVQALTQSLTQLKDGTFSLRNGPYMRRFLDGYFPLEVSFKLDYAQTNLELISFSPATQIGFDVQKSAGRVTINAIFEGRLNTEFHFKTKKL